MNEVSKEAREAAEKECQHFFGPTKGMHVQALLDSIRQQHAEEMAKLRGAVNAANERADRHCREAGEREELREQLRAKEEEIREHTLDAELIDALRAENERLKGELEREWITQGDLREQSEVLKDRMEGLRSQLEAARKETP